MSNLRRWLLPASILGGVLLLKAAWLRQGQLNRSGLVSNAAELNWQALRQLGVAAEARYIPVNGLELYTVLAGPTDGPLVVLLHGFPEHWYTWRHQIAALAQAGYRVVAPDQRGYNLSDKPEGVHHYRIEALSADVVELIRSCGREKAIVVGHDWGGVVAWHLAMCHPDMVEKLIIMNAPHPAAYLRELRQNPAQQRKSWYIGFFQLPLLPELLLGHDPLESARSFFHTTAVKSEAFSSFELHVMATAIAQPQALNSMINWYRALVRYRGAQDSLRNIDAPTLLIWAEDDVALGKSLTYGLDQWVSNLRLHLIPQCGHWVQNEAAEEVNAQLLEFLAA